MISSSENVFQVRKRKLCQPSSVSFKGFGVGRSLYTPGPALSHLLPPFHLEGPRFLGCYLQQVWCVPRSQAFSPGWAGEPWLRKSRSSLAVVKVFTLPSPGPLGQKWCSSYWPDKAVKQTAKKTQPSLCSAEITLLEFQYWVIWLLAGALIAKMQIFFFSWSRRDYSSYQSRASYFKMKSLYWITDVRLYRAFQRLTTQRESMIY